MDVARFKYPPHVRPRVIYQTTFWATYILRILCEEHVDRFHRQTWTIADKLLTWCDSGCHWNFCGKQCSPSTIGMVRVYLWPLIWRCLVLVNNSVVAQDGREDTSCCLQKTGKQLVACTRRKVVVLILIAQLSQKRFSLVTMIILGERARDVIPEYVEPEHIIFL